MKKNLQKIMLYGLLLVGAATQGRAQSAATATWPLNNTGGASGRRVEASGAITALEQSLGGLNDATYSASTGQSNPPRTIGGGWQRLTSISTYTATSTATPPVTSPSIPYLTSEGTAVPDYTHYAEFKVSPNENTNLTVKEFRISALGGGTSNARLVVLYSLDNFATAGLPMPVQANYFTSAGAAATFAATESEPVVLINTGTAFIDEQGVPNGIEKLSFSGMNISVAPGQSFSIRVYPFLSSASPTSARYFMSQQASISGETTPLTTNPLNFLSFTAETDGPGGLVKLAWKTANEVNTKNFIIERSSGAEFNPIGNVPSANTAGTHVYSFIDHSPLTGASYYRLKQVDNDGKFNYSKEIPLKNKAAVSVSVYPSPAIGVQATVSHPMASSDAVIKVLNAAGVQVLKQAVAAGTTTSNIDISALGSGYYLLIYANAKEEKSIKFVKQ